MIRKFFAVLAMVAAVALVASPAQAGGSGGGAKKSVTMQVLNTMAADQKGSPVLYLPTGGTVPTTVDAFYAAGGKVVNPGQTVNFLVAPGTGTAIVANPDAPATVGTAGYTATAGKVGRAKVAGTNAAPTIAGY